MDEQFLDKPQWIMRNRLLKLGEKLRFTLYVPDGTEPGELRLFERFLETAGRDAGEPPILGFTLRGDRYAEIEWEPACCGNHLIKWTVGGETLSRYFSVIEDDYIVAAFSTFFLPDPEPSLHDVGIPLDYRLPVWQFD